MDTPNIVTGLILVLVVLALLAGVILLYRRDGGKETSEPPPMAMREQIPVTGQPQVFTAPRSGDAPSTMSAALNDDLTLIEGIGPVIAQKLSGAGIHTFQMLADSETEHIEVVLAEAGLHLVDASTWRDQARLAAAGNWTDFEDLKRQLNRGRKTM